MKEEIEENIITQDENLDYQGLEESHFNVKKINSFLYIIPEVIFIACFLSGNFYEDHTHIFLFIPNFIPILIFNCCFFAKRNLICLNNYLLLTKFLSIEVLIFYPILIIIKDSHKEQEDLVFIIIFILGALSGLFSLIYLFLYYYIFQNGLSEFKKIYFLYFELIAIIIVHPLFIYYYYTDSLNSITSAVIKFLELFSAFSSEVILFIVNLIFLCLDSDKCILKIIIAIIKIILYILVEFTSMLMIDYSLNDEKYIYFSITFFFMMVSLFFFLLNKIKKN
jgi:hypothetical protein